MQQPNIIFIIIDALRARNLGCYGYPKPTSPNIDDLAREGVLFEDAFSCVNATDPSLTTIFSGKYPRSHGIVRHSEKFTKETVQRFNESQTRFLPQILKENGYATLAVDWLGRWHKQGYDYYSGISQKLRNKPLYWLMVKSLRFRPLYEALRKFYKPTMLIEKADAVTDKAMRLLRKIHGERFFLLIHYWDTHYPYNPPKQYVDQFINGDYGNSIDASEILSQFNSKHRADLRDRLGKATTTGEALAKYDAAIAFVDYHVGKLVESLKEHDVLNRTLVVLTSDHGESLTEHGIYFEHHGLYEVSIHVPLIMLHSEFPKGKRINGFVQHTDLTPTITDVLDVEAQYAAFDGRSLVPLIRGKTNQLHSAVYVEEADTARKAAIRTSEYKYIHALDEDLTCKRCGRIHGGTEELYDLRKDPAETQNIVQENPEVTELLRKKLYGWIEFLELKKTRKGKLGQIGLDEDLENKEQEKEIMERLRRLGYI